MSAAFAILQALLAHDTAATVDQEVRIVLGRDAIAIEYAVDLNRPAAFVEVLLIDADRDGRLTKEEQARYFLDLERTLLAGLELRVNGARIPLRPAGEPRLSMPFRKLYRFEEPHPPGWDRRTVVEFHNDNFLDWTGSITIALDPTDAADITYSSLGKSTPGPQRDVVLHYRRGTGKVEQGEAPAAEALGAEGIAGPRPRAPRGKFAWLGLILMALFIGSKLHPMVREMWADRRWLFFGLVAATGAGVAWQVAIRPRDPLPLPSEALAREIFEKLHLNIYGAFEAGSEGETYDILARSLEGRTLDRAYEEVHEALVLRDRGSSRFSVRRVRGVETEVLRADGPSYGVRHRWRVYGTVTHSGHTHARVHEYEAVYRVRHDGRAWKIAGTDLRQQQRVPVGQWKPAS